MIVCRWPAQVARGGVTSGHRNFLTGAGGYVQNVVNGYAGLRYSAEGLRVLPVLPPDGVTKVVLRAVSYAGCRLTVEYDSGALRATLLRCGGAADAEAGAAAAADDDDAAAAATPMPPTLVLRRNGADATVLALQKTVVLLRADGDTFTVAVAVPPQTAS